MLCTINVAGASVYGLNLLMYIPNAKLAYQPSISRVTRGIPALASGSVRCAGDSHIQFPPHSQTCDCLATPNTYRPEYDGGDGHHQAEAADVAAAMVLASMLADILGGG